jgi:transposase
LTGFEDKNNSKSTTMANVEQLEKLTRKERQTRYFSEDFKKKKVNEIERKLASVVEVSRQYQVSRAAIYNWIYKYSMGQKKETRLVVETKSDTIKIKLLQEKLQELERMIGQKQIQIDFLEKMIEIAGEKYGIDIKKKHSTTPSPSSGKVDKNTPTK